MNNTYPLIALLFFTLVGGPRIAADELPALSAALCTTIGRRSSRGSALAGAAIARSAAALSRTVATAARPRRWALRIPIMVESPPSLRPTAGATPGRPETAPGPARRADSLGSAGQRQAGARGTPIASEVGASLGSRT